MYKGECNRYLSGPHAACSLGKIEINKQANTWDFYIGQQW